jgi:hypothetical protein
VTGPILTADQILQESIYNAIASLMTAYQTGGYPRLFYRLAPTDVVKPLIVYQPQSDFNRADVIGDSGISVLVTLKAIADDMQSARDVLATAVAGMLSLSYTSYQVAARYQSSPIIPFDGMEWQVAHVFRVTIRHAP